MIYKTGQKVYELQDEEIKEHTIEDFKFVTWIQKLKINGEWRPADDFHPTLKAAMESDERHVFRMNR
jgi:hypothetical protein